MRVFAAPPPRPRQRPLVVTRDDALHVTLEPPEEGVPPQALKEVVGATLLRNEGTNQ